MTSYLRVLGALLASTVFVFGHLGDGENEMQIPTDGLADEQGPVELLGLKWHNCHETRKAIELVSLSVTPDPVLLGSKVTISGEVDVKENVGVYGQIIKADAVLKMKIGEQYVDLCGLFGQSNCHVKDLCAFLKKKSMKCPAIVQRQGNNCTCPIMQKLYEVKDLSIMLPVLPIELSGSFDVKLTLNDQKRELACFEVKFCIKKCN